MSEQNELLTAMNALLAKASATPTAPAAGSGWAQPQPAPAAIQGVGVPCKVSTPIGEVRVYLWLDGAAAASPQAMQAAIQSLVHAGLPVEAWQPRESGWQAGNTGWQGNNNNRWRR